VIVVVVVAVEVVEVVEVDTTVEAAAAAANFLLISSLIDNVFLTGGAGSFLVCVCGITSLLREADARFGAPLPPPPPAEPALFRLPPALFISQFKSHEIEKKKRKIFTSSNISANSNIYQTLRSIGTSQKEKKRKERKT
jgi:hypothetical protein